MEQAVRQWQCPCGEWLDMSVAKHIHVKLSEPTLAEMIQCRHAGNDEAALSAKADTTEVIWKPEYPRRDRPND